MADNSAIAPSGDVIRDLDRLGSGIKTQVTQIDFGGGSGNAEQLASTANPFPTAATGSYFVASAANSSTAQLAAGASFVGTIEAIPTALDLSLNIPTDQPLAVVVNFYATISATSFIGSLPAVAVQAGAGLNRSFPTNGNFCNVVVTNTGTAATTTLKIDAQYGSIPAADQAGNAPVAIYGSGDLAGVNLLEAAMNDGGDLAVNVRIRNAQTVLDAPQPTTYIMGVAGTQFILDTTGYQSIQLELAGTWAGTVTFTCSSDLETWSPLNVVNSTAPYTLVQTATANGQFIAPAAARYVRVAMTTYTSGQAIAIPYLRLSPAFTAAQVNLGHIGGTAVVTAGVAGIPAVGGNIAAGVAPTANPVLVGGIDYNGLTRRVQTDVQGNPVAVGMLATGYQVGAYNVTYSGYTSALASITAAQSSVSPVIIGGTDQSGSVRRALTDQTGAVAITSAPATQAQQSIHDLLGQLLAAVRTSNHYLYELFAADSGNRTVGDEPDVLQAEYANPANSFSNLVN